MKKTTSFLCYIITVFFTACSPYAAIENNSFSKPLTDTINPQIIAGKYSDQKKLKLDSVDIVHFIQVYPLFTPFRKDLNYFYKSRAYSLAWHDTNGRIESVYILYNKILQIEENGVPAEIPYLEDYKRGIGKPENDSIVMIDLMQTAQYLHFANHVFGGVPENESKRLEWFIPRKKNDYLQLLDQTIAGKTDSLEAHLYPQYQLLKKNLSKYYLLQKKGGWVAISTTKKKIMSGDSLPVIAQIKERLFLTGELRSVENPSVYDQSLEEAVRLFQNNHGLKNDGIIGSKTLQQLNITVEERIKQIIVNMERCRWLPNETRDDYLVVNIPAFNLLVMHGDSLVFSCEAIVGKETNKTVIFKGHLKYVVFNPYWNVPDGILKKEILPLLNTDKNYLTKNNMEWYRGQLRQRPGPDNPLGEIKFVFPNPFDIYLHDTQAKSLFGEEKRAFSHGCIRISAPFELALYLLRNKKDWGSDKIRALMDGNTERYLQLDKTVPIYIVYFTAFVDFQGNLNFRNDIYARDKPLLKMLMKN